MKYVLVKKNSKMGYRGKKITDDNVNSFSDKLKAIWLNAGLIKEVKQPKNKD